MEDRMTSRCPLQVVVVVGGLIHQNSLLAGHSSVLCLFCALRNLPDCARLEMLQTEFRREMPRSGSFLGVRGRPQSRDGVCDGVFADDFGK